MLSLEEARERVEKIRAVTFDDEVAHSREDSLYTDVLETIAEPGFSNLEHARELAKIALSTKDISFARWCA